MFRARAWGRVAGQFIFKCGNDALGLEYPPQRFHVRSALQQVRVACSKPALRKPGGPPPGLSFVAPADANSAVMVEKLFCRAFRIGEMSVSISRHTHLVFDASY